MLRSILTLTLVFAFCFSAIPAAQAAEWTSESRAEKVYKYNTDCLERFDKKNGDEMVTGELFCWHMRLNLGFLIKGYKAFEDVVWLEYTEKILDNLCRRLAVGPDGYKGFIGPFIYDPNYRTDVHVGDAILFEIMLEFSEIVLSDTKLSPRFADKARFYISLVEKHLIEKWDSRGTWYEDGSVGAYHSWNMFSTAEKPDLWQAALEDWDKSKISLPINKSLHLANSCLILNRLTGKQKYLDKAEKIFNWHRLHMHRYKNCYIWNYWEPQTEVDIDWENNRPLHWVNTHPYRNYQAGEVGELVKAYDMGIVFTKEDIEAIIRTNLEIMFNGDMKNPSFGNSNVTLPGYKAPTASDAYPTWAGTMWTSLVRFDPTLKQLYSDRMDKISLSDNKITDDLDKIYFDRVTSKQEVGFKRKYRPDALVQAKSMPDSGGQVCATAIPMSFAAGDVTTLIAKLPADGELKVVIYDADGKNPLVTLFDDQATGHFDGMQGFVMVKWDGKIDGHITPGNYTASWFYNGGRRDYPLNITSEK